MKKLIVILLIIPIVSIGQTFEITNGQSMCMIGKGKGQDATINPYADEDYSYALIENIGLAEFQIRVESTTKDFKQFLYYLGNLDSVGTCLLHDNPRIQDRAFDLLLKLETQPFSKASFDRMNSFLKNTLERKRKSVNQVKNRNNGTLDDLDVDVIVE